MYRLHKWYSVLYDTVHKLTCQSIIYLHVHSLCAVVLEDHFLADSITDDGTTNSYLVPL